MDRVDRIIRANSPDRAGHLLVVDAPELVEPASRLTGRVSVWCDDIRDARRVATGLLIDRLDAGALAGVDLVWLRLPPALAALDEYAATVACHAHRTVRLIAGGRNKYLTRSTTEVLGRHFAQVRGSLGAQNSRALLASGPIPVATGWPRRRILRGADIGLADDLVQWSHGATFAAGRLDAGTRLLIAQLPLVAEAGRYLDLGCGSGVLATVLARRHPGAEVFAVDASRAAVSATRRTAAGTQVVTSWAADLAGFGAGELDVIVCNPPFHRGTAKDSQPAQAMFAEAARTLGEGGEFWCVFNSHLPWRNRLARLIGPTSLIGQDRRYTVTRSVRRLTRPG